MINLLWILKGLYFKTEYIDVTVQKPKLHQPDYQGYRTPKNWWWYVLNSANPRLNLNSKIDSTFRQVYAQWLSRLNQLLGCLKCSPWSQSSRYSPSRPRRKVFSWWINFHQKWPPLQNRQRFHLRGNQTTTSKFVLSSISEGQVDLSVRQNPQN